MVVLAIQNTQKSLHTSYFLWDNTIKKLGKKVFVFSGKIHFYFAFIIWLLMVGVNNFWFNPIPFLIGSIFPDCDHRKAPMGKILPLWFICRHRGFTHTIWGLVLFSSMVAIYDWKWGMIFAAGYFIHLAMDSGTPMGIKWITGHKKRAYR